MLIFIETSLHLWMGWDIVLTTCDATHKGKLGGISKRKLYPPPKHHAHFTCCMMTIRVLCLPLLYTDPPRNLIQKTELSWSSLFEMTPSTTSYTNLIDLWWLAGLEWENPEWNRNCNMTNYWTQSTINKYHHYQSMSLNLWMGWDLLQGSIVDYLGKV